MDMNKRVIFVLMSICSADAAALNFNEDVVVTNFWKIILLKLKMFLLCHHCYSCFFWNCVSCRSSRSACCSSCCRSVSCHAGENLFNDFFDIYIVHILVKNGPSYSALGFGGEGFCTFTIASRTGEGLTSASTFTKRRRCVMTDSLCIR